MAKAGETPTHRATKTGERGAFPQAKLLAFPEVKGLLIPEPYTACLQGIVPHFLFPPELSLLLTASETAEVQVKKLQAAFRLFPDDFARFIALVKALRQKGDQTLSQEAAIRAYGMEPTKLFIFSIFVVQSVTSKPFQWDPQSGRPKVDPQSILMHTLRIADAYQGREVNLAFGAGLPFDILSLIARKVHEQPKPVLEFIHLLTKRGIEAAKIGVALGRGSKDLRLSAFMYSACVLQYAGEAALAVLDPEYVKFHGKMAKDDLSSAARKVCEEKAFGISADRLGAMICRYFQNFRPVAEALLYRKQPFVHELSGNRDLHQLAAACCLASNIEARPMELIDESDSRMKKRWLTRELGTTGFSPSQIYEALESIVEEEEA
jgi:hypothetical protein